MNPRQLDRGDFYHYRAWAAGIADTYAQIICLLRKAPLDALANIPTVAHAIQQAVAPVFLLTGIGSILSVLAGRLSRVVDRSRLLNEMKGDAEEKHRDEIRILLRRARWNHWAISLCTVSALCICLSIAALFIGAELRVDLSGTVSLLFVAAMLTLISGLLCFLREIALATGVIEIRKY
jgi:hypothetical protein